VRCPCGGADYQTCCEPLHQGTKRAETAEALMRSRYSAYVLGVGPYLLETSWPPAPATPGSSADDMAQWGREKTWVGLSIERVEAGDVADDGGFVQFVAKYVEPGALVSLSERSEFRRVEGRWRYVEGAAHVARTKLGRNDQCPCGSGKKVKHCHS
jgi:SEC-C motif-containing protein